MISHRYYIFADDGSLKRVSHRVVDGLTHGNDAVPEYASSRQRVAHVMIRLDEKRKPAQILDVQGSYWTFDERGRIDDGLRSSVAEAMDFAFAAPPKTDGRVVDLTPTFKKRAFRAKHRWEPTKDEFDRLAADLTPGADASSASVKAVKGKAPAKPPLTWAGEQALREIRDVHFKIGTALNDLPERALRGLAFEARRLAVSEEDGPLWAGIADEADRRREILARKRTGKGVWFAVIEGWANDPTDPRLTRQMEIASERCEGRAAAVEATRRLLRDHAHRFSADLRIEASVVSELEWRVGDE